MSACATTPSPPDAPETDAPEGIDVGPEACAVDVTCPERPPSAGAFCEGALSCEYDEGSLCTAPWRAICETGRWTVIEPPPERCGGARPPPRTAELCSMPFAGAVEGSVSLEIVRDRLVVGTQGTPMLAIQVRLDGPASALDCVRVAPELRVDGVVRMTSTRNLRLRCGSTTGLLVLVFADDVCDGAPHEADITIDVEGVGGASASATILGCD